MNPEKRDYNGWIMCPSTRFHGKFYYFNPATGEAVWNLGDMERRMVPQPNFTHSDRWHMYPEPDSPPEDTNTSWGYQPDFRAYPHHHSPPFGQAIFPKYTPNMMEMMPSTMPSWGMPQSMYMQPMMNPMFNPMYQPWTNFRANPKHFMQEKNIFPNPYMQRGPNFNQGTRQVFGTKPKPNVPIFPQMNNLNKDLLKKRTHPAMDYGNVKEPLFKRLRSPNDLQNESLFGGRDNLFQTSSFGSSVPEKVDQPFKTPVFQQYNPQKLCDCMISKYQENSSSQFSKSHANLASIGKAKESLLKPAKLTEPRSVDSLCESLVVSPSEISSNFSLQGSFVFPLNKSESKVSSTKGPSPKRKVQNSTVSQSGQDTKKVQSGSSDSKLSETDLRYILKAKRRMSTASDLQEMEQTKGKKIKTTYTNDKLGERSSKKRVTFDLGVASEDHDADGAYAAETLDVPEQCEEAVAKLCYVVADTDVLLTEFELIEEFVKSDEVYTLLIPERVLRDIESTCGGPGGPGGGARRRVLAARSIARRLADNQPHIQVHSEDPERGGETDEPALNCCLRVYDEGHSAILITNNSDLYTKATSNDVECYTVQEIKDHMGTPKPEISFDLKKINENAEMDEITSFGEIPVNCTRKKLLENTHLEQNPNQFFRNNKSTIEPKKSCIENRNFQLKRQINVNTKSSFFDKYVDIVEESQLNHKIETLNLFEKINVQKNREALAAKKQETEKRNSCAFKNGDEAKEENLTARKQLKSVNVYNVDGLLKSFSVKSKEMEERIVIRMDEYVCVFCQIMEAMLLNILKDYTHLVEDFTKTPLQNLITSLREVFPDHRTAQVLIDKLSSVLDCAFVCNNNGRLKLVLNPNGFVKMLACGTLLVKVLRDVLPSERTLEEGEVLLEQLERSVEEWGEEPELAGTPAARGAAPPPPPPPRPQFVKNTSDVLQYLTKYFPEWRSYNMTENNNGQPVDNHNNKSEVKDKPTSKVIRTFGRHLGLLKLNLEKPLIFTDKENNKENIEAKKQEPKEVNKPKMIKKLALESLNLPPKFKEIDVEKRENDDKQLTEMLDEMVKANKPLTKYYDLKSIIIDEKDTNEINKSKNFNKMNLKDDYNKMKDLKSKVFETTNKVINDKANNEKANNEKANNDKANNDKANNDKANNDKANNDKANNEKANNGKANNDDSKDDNDQKLINNEIYKHALDLDALDYSDIEDSVIQAESIMYDDSSSIKLEIDESDNSNNVTTTQHETSPNIDKENNKNDKGNDNSDNVNNNICNNNDASENDDSGIESFQAFTLVQLFLMNLSKTFLMIKQFLDEASIIDLNNKIDDNSMEFFNKKADDAHTTVIRIIYNLNLIANRESNPETALRPLLVKGDPEPDTDKRIAKYSLVIGKCLRVARALQRSLRLVRRATRRAVRAGDLPDHPSIVPTCLSSLV